MNLLSQEQLVDLYYHYSLLISMHDENLELIIL